MLGYDFAYTNFQDFDTDGLENLARQSNIADVLIVKKHYPEAKRNRGRAWKLKRMTVERGEEGQGQTQKTNSRKAAEEANRDEYVRTGAGCWDWAWVWGWALGKG